MIQLMNGRIPGRKLTYIIASGGLGFDGKGWAHERLLVKCGLIKPELFTVITPTLTFARREGYFRWWKPWESIRLISGGVVNKKGLRNKGFTWWNKDVAPGIDFAKNDIIASLAGTPDELVVMIRKLNHLNLAAFEINWSCPNTGKPLPTTETIVDGTKKAYDSSRHPLIIKVCTAQNYAKIAYQLRKTAQAIDLNSVLWEMAFRREKSPLWKLQERVGGGGGGVSGKLAQKFTWPVARKIIDQGYLPVIIPHIMEYEDIEKATKMGGSAFSFGVIHMPTYPLWRNPWTILTNPCKPTWFVERRMGREENRAIAFSLELVY